MRALLFFFSLFIIPALQAQTYITHVNLVDVENMTLKKNQTVIISGEKIIGIKASNHEGIPATAKVIDGTGKYLMPGLVDAHVHFFQSGGLYTRPDVIDLRKYHSYDEENRWVHNNFQDLLQRYLRAGITTVIDPGSTLSFLRQRDTLDADATLPMVYMTGPLLTTYEPVVYEGLGMEEPFFKMNSPEEARRFVQKEIPFKPDFIKIWYIVLGVNKDSSARASLAMVKAAIDEAHLHHLKVAVHATERVTAQLAAENGADYLVHSVDDEVVNDDFVQTLKTHHVILCPTLIVGKNYYRVFAQQYKPSSKDSVLANPEILNSLFDLQGIQDTMLAKRYKWQSEMLLKQAGREDSVMAANLKKLHNAGVTIATGTDAGNIGTMHASSYFDEIRAMKKAGLSVPEILQASTVNGAKVLGKEKLFGSIQKGKLANMVLLSANPLDDLANWEKVVAVINKGNIVP